MRFIAFALAAFAASTPALAQGWQEYSYPDYAFAVSFPAAPTIETTTYQAPDGRSVEARVYSATADNTSFKVTVADLSGADNVEAAVLDNAVKLLSRGSEVKVDIPHRVMRVYGRQLSIAEADGSRVLAAVFFFKDRLYQIEGKSLGGAGGTGDAIRFQQSLMFTGGATNRAAAGGGEYQGFGTGDNRRCRNPENAERCRRRAQQDPVVPQ